jgi:hypothetical protein
MSTAFFIVGLLITAAGAVMVFLARFQRPTTGGTEEAFDVGKVLEEFNKLLDKIEQQYRIGVVMMGFGLALVGVGAWLEAKDAKDAAQEPSAMAQPAI